MSHLLPTEYLLGQFGTICIFDMKTRQQGFIAFISILILSAALLVTTFGLAQFSIANRFIILNLEQKSSSENLAEACVHIARIKTYNDQTFSILSPQIINLTSGSCTINSLSVDEVTTTIEVQATDHEATSNFIVKVNNSTGDFISWTQVTSF
jgi:hypothetical protein